MSGVEGKLRELDGRTMVLREGVVAADGEITDGMIEIDFILSDTGDEVIIEETIAAGSVFRLPKKDEVALLGFVDGDRNEGYVLGWIPRPDASPAPSISRGTVYVWAPEGEDIRIVSDKRVTIDAPEIRGGGDANTDPVALSSRVDANELLIKTILEAHQHVFIAPLIPIAPLPTLPGAPTQIVGPLQPTGAGKLKG